MSIQNPIVKVIIHTKHQHKHNPYLVLSPSSFPPMVITQVSHKLSELCWCCIDHRSSLRGILLHLLSSFSHKSSTFCRDIDIWLCECMLDLEIISLTFYPCRVNARVVYLPTHGSKFSHQSSKARLNYSHPHLSLVAI